MQDIDEVDVTRLHNVQSEVSFQVLVSYGFQADIGSLIFFKVLVLNRLNFALGHNALVVGLK